MYVRMRRKPYIWTHVLYGHRARPALLDVQCPTCGACVRMSKASEQGWLITGDIDGSWHLDDWRGNCTQCIKLWTDYSYRNLPPLYYHDPSSGFWAWNREHMLRIDGILADDRSIHPEFAFFDAFLHKAWFKHKRQIRRFIHKKILN